MDQSSTDDLNKIYKEAVCIFDQNTVEAAISAIASKITQDLQGKQPLFLVVMKGAAVFAGQLLTHLEFPLELDYLHVTRYRGATTGGNNHWIVKPQAQIEGRTIVILDDILDEGHTLLDIQAYCKQQGAAEVLTAVLIDKVHDRKATPGLKAEYHGLEAPDQYLFGYGMDYKEYWRNAPGIFALQE